MLDEFQAARKRAMDPFLDAGLVDVLECSHDITPPSEEERWMALVLHWLRVKRKSKQWAMDNKCWAGAKGYMKASRIWMPAPGEACESDVVTYDVHMDFGNLGPEVKKCYPFAWAEHCKTYQHCLYIVRFRKRYLSRRIGPERLSLLSAALQAGCVPVLVDHKDSLARMLYKDWCAGRVPAMPKEEKECVTVEANA